MKPTLLIAALVVAASTPAVAKCKLQSYEGTWRTFDRLVPSQKNIDYCEINLNYAPTTKRIQVGDSYCLDNKVGGRWILSGLEVKFNRNNCSMRLSYVDHNLVSNDHPTLRVFMDRGKTVAHGVMQYKPYGEPVVRTPVSLVKGAQ